MILAFDLQDLPGEAITVLALLFFSFVGWLKDRLTTPKEEPPTFEDEEMREVVWRRQMGEDSEQTRMPWEPQKPPPPPTIRFDPKPAQRAPAPPPPPAPPALPKVVTKVSKRESDLANAFERSTRRKSGNRTSHRRNVDRLLRSPSAAKDGILLMEILGPPVGLKPEHTPES